MGDSVYLYLELEFLLKEHECSCIPTFILLNETKLFLISYVSIETNKQQTKGYIDLYVF